MFEIIDRVSNGVKYEFRCESKDARDGFNHFCDLYEEGHLIAYNKIHYINRTWESYKFQSVMIGAVNEVIDTCRRAIRDIFCEQHGYKRVTEKRREELEKIIACDPKIKRLEELKRMLKEAKYGSEREREELESLDRLLKMTEALAQMGAFRNN